MDILVEENLNQIFIELPAQCKHFQADFVDAFAIKFHICTIISGKTRRTTPVKFPCQGGMLICTACRKIDACNQRRNSSADGNPSDSERLLQITVDLP